MIESSKRVKPWREAVKWAALAAMQREDWKTATGPVTTLIQFYLPMPKSIPKGKRATAFPTKRPDIDKLVRSTYDALSECGVWKDDSLVTFSQAEKLYAREEPLGAHIRIDAIPPER